MSDPVGRTEQTRLRRGMRCSHSTQWYHRGRQHPADCHGIHSHQRRDRRGGGVTDSDGAQRQGRARTSNNDDVFPALCATDGSKQFIDNQSIRSGRLIIQPCDSDGGRQRQDCGGRGDVRLPESRGGGSDDCVASNGEDVIGALCARDFKGVGSQYVGEGKVIVQRNE